MVKFKIGDKIECLKNIKNKESWGNLTMVKDCYINEILKLKTLTILKYDKRDNTLKIEEDTIYWYPANCFKFKTKNNIYELW